LTHLLIQAVPLVAAAAGGTALAAYLDAKFHIRSDWRRGSTKALIDDSMKWLAEQMAKDKM
jgi:hypothetical protein